MQTFTITTSPPREIHVPTSWLDITVGQLLTLWAQPALPRLHVLAGLSIEEVNSLALEDLVYFTNCLEFMLNRHELNEILKHIQS